MPPASVQHPGHQMEPQHDAGRVVCFQGPGGAPEPELAFAELSDPDCLTQVEAHLLDAVAGRDLGDERASREAAEQALNLAEPDRLILPFAMTGAWQLLETVPEHSTSHAALVTDILDATRGPGRGGLNRAAMIPVEELSRSELRVLRYLPTNLTRREIARQLSVSLNTVDTHIHRIYAKLGATDRTAAVERARELRLLSVGRT